MKYMLLVCHDEQAWGKVSETEQQRALDESVQLTHQLHSVGQYLDAAPLLPTSTATSVRVREGKRLVTDGPFAETREQLAGYFLIEARDLDEAIDIAGRVPGARWGTVEIRPVKEVAGLPAELAQRRRTGHPRSTSRSLARRPARRSGRSEG